MTRCSGPVPDDAARQRRCTVLSVSVAPSGPAELVVRTFGPRHGLVRPQSRPAGSAPAWSVMHPAMTFAGTALGPRPALPARSRAHRRRGQAQAVQLMVIVADLGGLLRPGRPRRCAPSTTLAPAGRCGANHTGHPPWSRAGDVELLPAAASGPTTCPCLTAAARHGRADSLGSSERGTPPSLGPIVRGDVAGAGPP